MKKSPVYPNCEKGDYCVFEVDLQQDFAEFLEEARTHTSQGNFKAASPYPEAARKKQLGGDKKNKKSWKSSIFSWLKAENKSKPIVEPSNASYIYKTKHGHVSGPVHGSGDASTGRAQRSTSGPLRSLFNPIKKVETEIPYMCLDQLTKPHDVQSYGPVYLVT